MVGEESKQEESIINQKDWNTDFFVKTQVDLRVAITDAVKGVVTSVLTSMETGNLSFRSWHTTEWDYKC